MSILSLVYCPYGSVSRIGRTSSIYTYLKLEKVKIMNVRIATLGGCLLMLIIAGCSSQTKVDSDLNIKGAPDWVNEGTQMLNDKDGRLFHGVGSAPAMGDASLQRATADDRARAEVAKILSSYLKVASKDYSSSASMGGEQANELSISREIENLTQVNLTGAKIIGRWSDKNTGTIWSVAELDLKRMKETMEKVEAVSPSLRNFLNKESDSIFDRMTGGQ